ncbi:MAG: flagellar brake domain-containing protein [Lachnospiraceae bacterium]|nr:flagellar brake domain-containing protein [Lachnospiraceae bacterium]
MDSRITIGDKIDLEKIETRLSADPDKHAPIYASQVLDESENGAILAAMPMKEGAVVPLGVGQKFFATFYTKSGLFRCEIEVSARYKKGTLFYMELTQNTVFKKIQRREYYRLECNMQMEYRLIGDEEKKLIESGIIYEEENVNPEWKKGVMLDLSGGGIRFVSAFQEKKDSFIQVRFEMPVGNEVEIFCLYARLLRSERNFNNTSIYTQRVKFWKLDNKLREKIIRSIFEIQRKMRLKVSGNT